MKEYAKYLAGLVIALIVIHVVLKGFKKVPVVGGVAGKIEDLID